MCYYSEQHSVKTALIRSGSTVRKIKVPPPLISSTSIFFIFLSSSLQFQSEILQAVNIY